MFKYIFISFWLILFFAILLYSFTQVDLGLTLTRASIFQTVQQSFQYIGYFNRSLSTTLFLIIVVSLTTMYGVTLYLSLKKKINNRIVWITIVSASTILFFSYNAFSYDLFNYIFDAKIVTHYGQNPYIHKALDYPQDPMLAFMHWTHRTYPYGPVWLGTTIPLSFIGSGYFLVTFYLFKLLMVGFYLLTSFIVYKIAKKNNFKNPLLILAFFALNPLVLMEALVSSHHELVMMAPALIGVYFLFEHKKYSPWFFLLLSAGIKFATIFMAPIFLWYPISKNKSKKELFFLMSVVVMVFAVVLATVRTNFQPWYLLFVLPFSAFLLNKYYIAIPTVVISVLALLQYVPFLYTGNFNFPIPILMNELLIISILSGVILTVGYGLLRHARKHS